jgi:glycosyltransferase involved in cell wall biosynthesis
LTIDDPIRVAHLIHSLGPGGAENVLAELAVAAPHAGIQPVFIGLSPAADNVHARLLRTLGAPVVELDLHRWDLRAVTATIRTLKDHRVQVVHTHLKHADLIGAAAGARLRLPVVSTLHVIEDAPLHCLHAFKRAAGLQARRRFAARTIALSRSQHKWYAAMAGTDRGVVVLPNGVADPGPTTSADHSALRAVLGVPDGGLLVASASLMRPEKGHALLLSSVARLPADLQIIVALAGDGPLRGELESRVEADPQLRDRVRFLGYRDDVPAVLAAADLVLHTSLADALPTTLIQALSVGTPAVATSVGGIPDIVSDRETGLLVPTDPDAIADAVVELARDPGQRHRYGVAGRMRFLETFEAIGWACRLHAVYESVMTDAAGTTAPRTTSPLNRARPRS